MDFLINLRTEREKEREEAKTRREEEEEEAGMIILDRMKEES